MYRKLLLALLVAVVLPNLMGCSSSSTKKDGAELEATLTQDDESLPDADEVGSIPEDNQDSLDELAKTGPGEDPFADLEDNLEQNGETAQPGPSGGSGEMKTYTVQRGDTLMKIAFFLYGDIDRWKDLRSWNKGAIARVSQLEPGTQIKYADEGEFVLQKHDYSYKIQNGDTLGGIAKNIYGKTSKWRKLQQYNSRLIKDPNRIFAGFSLYYDITAEEQQQAEQMRNQIGSSAPPPAAEAPMSAEAPAPAVAAPSMPAAEPLQPGTEPVAAMPAEAVSQ